MNTNNCCSSNEKFTTTTENFEFIKLEKTKKVCPLCEDFSKKQMEKQYPIAVISCEGACLRGEVSRQAANLICYSLMPDKTSRICLGGAFTKDGGQRELVKTSQRVIALEGCFINCSSRMMKGVIDGLEPEIIQVDKLYEFNTDLFAINEVEEKEIKEFAAIAADKIVKIVNS
ncbi:MAG TPA: putative zinc-binding protein [Candidatus Kapabacteria bacterium]|nr:putative zinc-binding protein [Candidatus Kapabacteria bacterium]HPO63666.1 putative zinc-binding protein [Candidatus Kapabacteria bacterium]